MPHDIANAVSIFLQITVFLVGVYYLAIGFFSLFSPPVKKETVTAPDLPL